MAINTNQVVAFDAATRRHTPVAAGDQLAGGIIQISTDPGNILTLGADGGLRALSTVGLPDDQVLTGDNAGSALVTLTPTVVGDQTDYAIRVDVKLAPAQPTGANQAVLAGDSIYVAPQLQDGAAVAPVVSDDGILPTTVFGTQTNLLGTPTGWVTAVVPGVGPVKLPYYV